MNVKIERFWGLPSLCIRFGKYSFSILLTHKMLFNAREHFSWFGLYKNRRVNLVTEWDRDIKLFGVCFQLQKYKWYMYSKQDKQGV